MRNDKDGERRAMQMRVGLVAVAVGLTLLARSLVDPAGQSLAWIWVQLVVAVAGLFAIVIYRVRTISRLRPAKVTSSAENELSSTH